MPFQLRRPSREDVERCLSEARELPLSYAPVGIAEQGAPGFRLDERVTVVGSGEAAYGRATRALTEWRQFELGWVELLPRGAPISPGTTVVVSVYHLGFWSLNGCRVVYRVGAPDGAEFGFAYGTLANHAEIGEEIFKVRLSRETGQVSYVIRAVSKPGAALARIGYPLVRSLQARFRRESTVALRRAIAEPAR
jgi:uncharacterized protein (UPF0548 family)